MKFKSKIFVLLRSILKSYSQVFFSENILLASILLLVSFFDWQAGLSGFTAAFISNSVAYFGGYNTEKIKKGIYGFNSLLVGLGLGLAFNLSQELLIIVAFISLFTFFVTVSLEGVLVKYGLPFLSIPFLIGIWIIFIAAKDFSALGLSERGVYIYNDLYTIGGQSLINAHEYLSNINWLPGLKVYFLSLGAIFFQNSIFAGILISLGLLFYSRITFSLSLIGFYTAFIFYKITGANFSELEYTFIGFNYILTSIAIGGYFFIPSKGSYLWTILLLPVTVVLSAGLFKIFLVWGISIYSLPFNITVILFVYSMKVRLVKKGGMKDTFVKQKTPEKTLYLNKTLETNYSSEYYFPVSLPFWGEWRVSQAHDGEYTHKNEWRHAWDFIITDKNGKQFKNEGDFLEDYFCYDKIIVAPADGIIEQIIDGIDDNKISEVNTVQNWGNTVVIKHTEFLYSQLSHIKKGTFNVKKGDFVRKGQVLAKVGNSGYSPYPHLHFQLQAYPFVGSKTFNYPLSNFLNANDEKSDFISFGLPKKDDVLISAEKDELIVDAFDFTPGKKLKVSYNSEEKHEWEVHKNIFNETYFYCTETKSTAYFILKENEFCFRNFYGNKKSDLFTFYKAVNKLRLSFYKNSEMKIKMRPDLIFSKYLMFFQDFSAPFVFFVKSYFKLKYCEKDDDFSPEYVTVESKISKTIFRKNISFEKYKITIKNDRSIIINSPEFEIKLETQKSFKNL